MDNRSCFLHLGNNRATLHVLSVPDRYCNLPLLFQIKGRRTDAAININAGFLRNRIQRALNSIKNIIQNPGAKRNRNRTAGRRHFCARLQSARFLIDLNCR